MKNALTTYHPVAAFLLFFAAIGFSMLNFHPVYSAISLLCSVALALRINGPKALRLSLRLCIPLFILTVFINTFFNKNGSTILFSIGDWPVLLEGFVFGLCSAASLCSIVLWFSCYAAVIDSEKFLFLFGRISPNAALLVSMTLGQVSQMRRKIKEINDAQEGIYGGERKKFSKRLRLAMLKVTVLLSWSMEDSISTADSMHARAYGTGKMSRMNPYSLGYKDKVLLGISFVLIGTCLLAVISGKASFRFYPVAEKISFDGSSILSYLAYFALFSLPLLVEIKEAFQWRFYMSKI